MPDQLTSQQEADCAIDGFRAARNGGWPGDCPHADGQARAAWLLGFQAWHDRLARRLHEHKDGTLELVTLH